MEGSDGELPFLKYPIAESRMESIEEVCLYKFVAIAVSCLTTVILNSSGVRGDCASTLLVLSSILTIDVSEIFGRIFSIFVIIFGVSTLVSSFA